MAKFFCEVFWFLSLAFPARPATWGEGFHQVEGMPGNMHYIIVPGKVGALDAKLWCNTLQAVLFKPASGQEMVDMVHFVVKRGVFPKRAFCWDMKGERTKSWTAMMHSLTYQQSYGTSTNLTTPKNNSIALESSVPTRKWTTSSAIARES